MSIDRFTFDDRDQPTETELEENFWRKVDDAWDQNKEFPPPPAETINPHHDHQ